MNSFIINRNDHVEILADHRKDPLIKKLLEVGDEVVICAKCKTVFLKDVWISQNGVCPNGTGNGNNRCGCTETLHYISPPKLKKIYFRKDNLSKIACSIDVISENKLSILDSSNLCKKHFIPEPFESTLKEYFEKFRIGIKDNGVLPFHNIYICCEKIHLKNPKNSEINRTYNCTIRIDLEYLDLKNSCWINNKNYDIIYIKTSSEKILINNKKVDEIFLYFRDNLIRNNISIKDIISRILVDLNTKRLERYNNGEKRI